MSGQNEMKSNRGTGRIVIFIIGFILLLGVAVLLFFWPVHEQIKEQPVEEQPKEEIKKEVSEYDGWNTYVNRVAGYSFKYPSAWNAIDNKYDAAGVLFWANATNEAGSGGVELQEFSGDIESYLAWEEKNISGVKFSNLKDVTLQSGLIAKRAEYNDLVSGTYYVIKKGNLIYKLFLNNTVVEDLAVFDKLALTFSVEENQLTGKDADGIFTLSPMVSLLLPEKWQIISTENNPQFVSYSAFDGNYRFNLTVVKLNEWLKGPNPDEGYVIPNEQRPAALAVLKNIYDHGKITPEDKKLFDKNAGEFLGYVSTGRELLNYFASEDNSFRGISFFNTQGQGPGVSPAYHISLYYPDQGLIVYGYYVMVDDFKELNMINEPFVNLKEFSGIVKLDRTAHEQFKKLIEKTPRKDLTFGAVLDTMDKLFKSLR